MLRHPWTMAAKNRVKDLLWTIKGRYVVNPPLPAPVHSILFICLGNICRSPFAAHLAAKRLAEWGVASIRCDSAGISARQANEVPAFARDVANRDYGLALAGHRPKRLSRELVDAVDLVVVMEAGQLESLRATYPDAAPKMVLLSLFDDAAASPLERFHIADPFSQPREAFVACFARIDRATTRLLGLARGPQR